MLSGGQRARVALARALYQVAEFKFLNIGFFFISSVINSSCFKRLWVPQCLKFLHSFLHF